MNITKATKKDLYYTIEHEWIDFQGAIAYVGVCPFKLTGFKEIHKVTFKESPGYVKQGKVIATVKYNEYEIDVCMPVDGKLQEINPDLVSGKRNLLLEQAEGSGWIAQIIPAQPYERKGLLLPKEYMFNGKSKYAKS